MTNIRFSSLITSSVIVKNASTAEDWARPGEEQRKAKTVFPGLVETSRLHLWKPGDDIPQRGVRFLVGAATYSLIEMYILDALNEWLERAPTAVKIEVFDLSACVSLVELGEYLPTAAPKASPILGLWSDGQFVRSLEGWAANQREYFRLDAILERLTGKGNEIGRELERLLKRNRTGFVRR